MYIFVFLFFFVDDLSEIPGMLKIPWLLDAGMSQLTLLVPNPRYWHFREAFDALVSYRCFFWYFRPDALKMMSLCQNKLYFRLVWSNFWACFCNNIFSFWKIDFNFFPCLKKLFKKTDEFLKVQVQWFI